MARRKEPAKPLFAVKHDFYDSLDAFLQEAVNLQQAVSSALDLDAIDESVAPIVRGRLDAFRAALLTTDD